MFQPIRILELRSVCGTGGGPEKTILQGAARTDRGRFAVTVCYLRDARDPAFGVTERTKDLPIEYLEILERHSFDPAIWPALRRLVTERRIQIVHAHDYKTNLLALMLGRVAPVVPLSTVHGWTGHSWRERLIYYPCDKRVLARFPRLIAVSSDIRNELIRHGAPESRVTTVLNGIDHEKFCRRPSAEPAARAALGFAPDEVVIGAVGRLEPQKRFDLLIEAFAQLRRRRPALRLVIAGDGSLRAPLEAQRDALGLTGVCRFTGHITDVSAVHHALDLFVQSSDYEGTPNAVLEAMALETPIVATDVGGTAELVRDGLDGIIVPPGDVPRLISSIDSMLDDRSAAASMAVHARRRVERELSFASRMRRVEDIYRELADSVPAAPELAGSCA